MTATQALASVGISDDAILVRGRDVVWAERDALTMLASALDGNFAIAVRLLATTTGRVIITGMGKSGHIGRKLVATMCATGTAAIFVHPAEAAHGDLGMIKRGDTVVMLSNSGATTELRPVMQHCRNLGVRIIGIASRMDSPLMQYCEVPLLIPAVPEACSANIAPTTSTAMMLALGDALALALMDLQGISHKSLKELHPGGAIGLKLMTVGEMMHGGDRMPLVSGDVPMRDVIMTMTSMGFGVAGVRDDEGRLVGIITDGDLRRHIGDLLDQTAHAVMTPNPKTVPVGMLAEDALMFLNDAQITTVFVINDRGSDCPVGIVHMHDFVRFGLSS
jgi:arabinose-5-phosphate isomerase